VLEIAKQRDAGDKEEGEQKEEDEEEEEEEEEEDLAEGVAAIGLVAEDDMILLATAVSQVEEPIFFGQIEEKLEQEDIDGDNEADSDAISDDGVEQGRYNVRLARMGVSREEVPSGMGEIYDDVTGQVIVVPLGDIPDDAYPKTSREELRLELHKRNAYDMEQIATIAHRYVSFCAPLG